MLSTIFPKKDLYNSFEQILVITATFIDKKEGHKLIRERERLNTNSVTKEINTAENLYSQLLVQFSEFNKIIYPGVNKEYITKKSNKYKSIKNIEDLFTELENSYDNFNKKLIEYCKNNCYRDYMRKCIKDKEENEPLLNISEEIEKIITFKNNKNSNNKPNNNPNSVSNSVPNSNRN